MSIAPSFTPEQLKFLATQLFDKQDEMFSYNLKPTKRKALLAALFKSANFDALLQRSKSQILNSDTPDDVFYQWMKPVGEKGCMTFEPFQPSFYDEPLNNQFSTEDDAIEIINKKDEYMLDAKDLSQATLMKITCNKVDNPFKSNEIVPESKDTPCGVQISENGLTVIHELFSLNTPSNVEELKKWIESENHLDMIDADNTSLTIDKSEKNDVLWMVADLNVDKQSKISISFKHHYIAHQLTSECFIIKSGNDEQFQFTGWSFKPDPSKDEACFWDYFENQQKYETLLTKSDLEHAYELMMQMYNRINKQL